MGLAKSYLRFTFALLLILVVVSAPKNSSPPMLSCIYADQTSFKSPLVSVVDDLLNKSQLTIFCEVSVCDNVPETAPKVVGSVEAYKVRPRNWSSEAFDKWRVWSENSDWCFFGESRQNRVLLD